MKLQGISKGGVNRIAQMEEGYQDFKNYATFAIIPWLDNDQNTNEYWSGRIDEIIEEAGTEDLVHMLADELQAAHKEDKPELDGVWNDLLNGALSEVNWLEIAQYMLSN